MQPLVPLVFHNLPSLYPPSFKRNEFLYLFHPFLTVPNAINRDVDTSLCSTRGSNSDRTGTTLRYKPLRYATLTAHTYTTLNFITRVCAGEVGVAHYPKWRRSLLIRAETRDFHSRRGMGARTIVWCRCTPLTIVQFRIKIRGFTLSCEALGRLLKKKKNMMTKIRKSRMSDISCEKTKVRMDS